MKKVLIFAGVGALFLSIFFSWTALASAHSFRSGDSVVVSGTEVIDETIFAAGRTIDINSEVNGDIFCAGQNVNISGTVNGDVICAAQNLRISGTVNGDVRLAGQTVSIGANVTGNATVASQTFTLESDGNVGGDVSLGSGDAHLNGEVGRDLAAAGANVTLSGSVGRNVKGTFDNLALSDTAQVSGNINYTSINELNQATGAEVGGSVDRTVPEQRENKFAVKWGWFLYVLLAMLFTSVMLVVFFPQVYRNVTERAMPRPWKAMLTGLIASFAVPVLFVLLCITIIGLPLAFLLFFLWIVLLILSGTFTAYYIGRLALNGVQNTIGIMAGGSVLLLILYFIPIIGFFALIFSLWTGTGMLLLELMRRTPRPAYVESTKPARSSKKG